MTRTSQALKRLGVASVALVTIGAGLPALLATSANAAPATQISIEPSTASAATGTCETFTVRLRDNAGNPADTATVTVELSDPSPANNTVAGANSTDDQSAVFCTRNNDGSTFTTIASNSDNGATSGTSNRRTITFIASGGSATFGVVDTQQETVTLSAFTDQDGNGVFNANTDFRSANATATFTPGSDQTAAGFDQDANDAVRTITEVVPTTTTAVTAGGSQTIQVRLTNAAGDEVRNAQPRIQVAAGGANSNGTTGNPATTAAPREGTCTVSNNLGLSSCQIAVPNAGQDQFVVFVNQTAGGTPGLDASEPRLTVTRTTSQAPNTDPNAARFIDLTPEGPVNAPSGTDRVFTATVTDAQGRAVEGVQVDFSEDGVGFFFSDSDNTSFIGRALTNSLGQVTVTLRTAPGEQGQSTVRAFITSSTVQCSQAAGQGANATATTAAGTCSDSEVTNFGAAASPSPTQGTTSPSPTGTTSPTTNPSPSGTGTAPGCAVVAQVRLERSTITATGSSGVSVTATANSVVDLLAYSRPSTTFRVVRSAEVGADGVAEFRITPPTNTRLFAQQRGCAAGPQVVLNVRTQLSLNVVRNGTRNYTFSGRALPARNGGLIVSLYRVTASGNQILTAQTRANASDGRYTIVRQFTGNGRFGFVVRTGQDLQNAPGASNVRSLLVF